MKFQNLAQFKILANEFETLHETPHIDVSYIPILALVI